MCLVWDPSVWEDYRNWQYADKRVLKRIDLLICVASSALLSSAWCRWGGTWRVVRDDLGPILAG